MVAFGAAILDRLEVHGDLLLDAEVASAGGWMRSPPYAVHWLHIHTLVERARPAGDLEYLTYVLLGALSAQVFRHQRHVHQMHLSRLKAGYAALVNRTLG